MSAAQEVKQASLQESSFVGAGGLKIFTRTWRLASARPRAVVVIVHGFNSHSGQYLWVADQFVDHDLAVYALDLRGRGKSEGERFYVEKMDDYIVDIDTLVNTAKTENPGLPVFLLGHSAGGVISCTYTLEHQAKLAGLICESFAFELPAPDLVLSLLAGVSHIAPHSHVFKLKNEDFSRDPQVVAAMNADPLIAGESQPAQTAAVLVHAAERLKAEFSQITLPVLILHGTLDKATKPSGSQHFYERAGSAHKTLKLYEGHYHDLLNDLDKESVMADILNWLDTYIPAA